MVCVLFLFLTRFDVNAARSNGNPGGLLLPSPCIYTKFFSS